jgi:hypothetical protein
LEQLIAEKGLTFGMDVAKYRLDEDWNETRKEK